MGDTQEMQEISEARKNPKVLTKPKIAVIEDSQPQSKPKDIAHEKPVATSNLEDFERLNVEFEDLKAAYNELRKDFKVTSRENREQSLELRDVKRQNASLKEAYNSIQKEAQGDNRKLSKNERTKYIEHFDMLEEQAAYFQHEFRKREGHLGYLTKQTRDANNEKDAIEEDNRKLQRKLRELSTNLTECRDDLLRLQPPSQTSDSEISDQYSNLCQQIAGWVDDQTEDPDSVEEYFNNLHSVADLPQDIRLDVNNRHFKFAKQSPECLPLLLQYLVHCRIQEDILGPSTFVFGLDETNVMLLQGIEEGMMELEPKRDTLTLRRWRSETLQGLLKMEAFAQEQSQAGEAFVESLASTISAMLSCSIDTKELHNQIVRPAIKLANAIRVSTTDYQFFSHLFARPSGQPNAVNRHEIQHYQMVDNTTHKIIRPDSNIRIADDGKIGEEMFVVSPGMARSNKDGLDRVVLCKPVILVKLDEPMGKRARGIKALGAWTPSWFGGEDAS